MIQDTLRPTKEARLGEPQSEHCHNLGDRTEIPQMPSLTQDLLQSIRIGLRDVAGETARNIQRLSQATVSQALEMGQQLWRMQRDLKLREYSAFLSVLGWASAKARKFINLAKVFSGFELSQLVGIELTTLFSLCSKRYSAVVEQLRDVPDITQQVVEQMIKPTRTPRLPKSDPISGWKRNRSGGGRRYEVILHDEQTGVSIEQQAQAEQVLPQFVIAEAVALRAQRQEASVQPNEYYRVQLEELQDVVDNARELERKNRSLELELSKRVIEIAARDRTIADLEAKLTERASVPREMFSEGLTGSNIGQELEPTQGSEQELSEHPHSRSDELEVQVAIQAPQTAEYVIETTETTDYLESAPEDDLLASVPQKEPVEEAAITTMTQDAVASEPVEPASQPEASDEASSKQLQKSLQDGLSNLQLTSKCSDRSLSFEALGPARIDCSTR